MNRPRQQARYAGIQQFTAFYFVASGILFAAAFIGALTGGIHNLPLFVTVIGAALVFLAVGQAMTLLLSIEANTRHMAAHVQRLAIRPPRHRTIVSRRTFP